MCGQVTTPAHAPIFARYCVAVDVIETQGFDISLPDPKLRGVRAVNVMSSFNTGLSAARRSLTEGVTLATSAHA